MLVAELTLFAGDEFYKIRSLEVLGIRKRIPLENETEVNTGGRTGCTH